MDRLVALSSFFVLLLAAQPASSVDGTNIGCRPSGQRCSSGSSLECIGGHERCVRQRRTLLGTDCSHKCSPGYQGQQQTDGLCRCLPVSVAGADPQIPQTPPPPPPAKQCTSASCTLPCPTGNTCKCVNGVSSCVAAAQMGPSCCTPACPVCPPGYVCPQFACAAPTAACPQCHIPVVTPPVDPHCCCNLDGVCQPDCSTCPALPGYPPVLGSSGGGSTDPRSRPTIRPTTKPVQRTLPKACGGKCGTRQKKPTPQPKAGMPMVLGR